MPFPSFHLYLHPFITCRVVQILVLGKAGNWLRESLSYAFTIISLPCPGNAEG